jgi:hypothetical protein
MKNKQGWGRGSSDKAAGRARAGPEFKSQDGISSCPFQNKETLRHHFYVFYQLAKV